MSSLRMNLPREFLATTLLPAVCLLAAFFVPTTFFAQHFTKQTHAYKVFEDLRIQLDAYQLTQKKKAPAILWIHGGALIFGHRGMINRAQLDRYLQSGFVVFSIDYRLAPETKLPLILKDLEDAYGWIRAEGSKIYGIDPNRIAVVGHSGGGYLTLASGYRLHPRPRALVAFYGYGDITSAWYSRPDPHYLKETPVSPETVEAAIRKRPLAESLKEEERWPIYLFYRQRGLWPREVAGIDPEREPAEFIPFSPLNNVSPDYPPTLLLHGDKDSDVPFEQSEKMDRELNRQKIPHEFIRVPGGEHGFDGAMQDPKVKSIFERVLTFLSQQTK